MKKFVLTMATLAIILAGGLVTAPRAEAMPIAAGIAAPVSGEGLLQEAAHRCRPVWRCGRYGCGWRRICAWAPGPYWGRRHYIAPRYRYRYRHWRR